MEKKQLVISGNDEYQLSSSILQKSEAENLKMNIKFMEEISKSNSSKQKFYTLPTDNINQLSEHDETSSKKEEAKNITDEEFYREDFE